MEKNFDIEKQKVLTIKQVIAIVTIAIIASNAITGFMWRLTIVEKEHATEKALLKKEIENNKARIEYVNDRLSRKLK